MSLVSRISFLIFLIAPTFAMGQSMVQQDLGIITAPQVASGLGWNLGNSEIEFQAAAAAGATHARLVDCGWSGVEGQSAPPNNVSTGYSLPPLCASSLAFAKKYGLKPTIVGSYGAPFHQILTVTLTSAAAAGATSVPVEFSSGVGGKTLSSIVYPYGYLDLGNGQHLSNKRSYAGTIITGLTLVGNNSATMNLASGLATALPAGTPLYVNEILYPSPVSGSPTDPSVIAYANYLQYMAQQIKAYGLTGDVEIWNEPPWFDECWDNRRNCYDADPGLPNELGSGVPNFGFAAALQLTTPVAGVPYVWAGANKTSSGGLLAPNMLKFTGSSFIQPQASVTFESMHPYGNNPEDATWIQPCVVANPSLGQHCNVISGSPGNMVLEETATLAARQANPNNGINHVITETGASTVNADLAHIARFSMRQYLGYMADDVSYVEFFRMYETPNAGQTLFSFVNLINNNTDFTPLPAYTAMAGLMSDIAPMKLAPVAAYSASTMPQVTSYSGTYDLDHLAIVGARSGDTANSILFTLWQRSQWQTSGGLATVCQTTTTTPCWGTVPQPAEASTTVSIPTGMKIYEVVNLDTRALVSYTQSGSSVTFGVSDDPIEVMFIPSADGVATAMTPNLLLASVADQIQGSSVVVHASSASKGAITYSIVNGPATISGSTVTVTDPGTVVVKASQAANGNYTAANTTTSFAVTAVTPVISFTTIQPRTYGDAVSVHAVSTSPGALTYSIVSGPATISGTSITLTGIGTVVVSVSQPKSGYYTAGTATTSFTVAAKNPNLAFATVPTPTYGTPIKISATSISSGAITYSVVSGPATMSGANLTVNDAGTVVIQASQAASGGYAAATVTTSFTVTAITPVINFTTIQPRTYGDAVSVHAVSTSPGALTYSIISGPATISGTAVTLTGTGTVVVGVSQAKSGFYIAGTATTSFTVAAKAPYLVFASIPAQTYGTPLKVSATSASSGAVTYSVVSGPATVSGSTITFTNSGQVTLQANQAASGGYTAATASASFHVGVTTPTLTFTPIATTPYNTTITVNATSPSPVPMIYSIVSGPARIVGATVTTQSTSGTVVVQAAQPGNNGYGPATATISFQVSPTVSPALSFSAVASKFAGDTFDVAASSASKGPVTYSLVSGPATLSGSTISTTAPGSVIVKATQAASGMYGAATATTAIAIAPIPALTFTAIPAKNAGDVFPLNATSPSPGAITYAIVSGPAIMVNGSTCEVTGAGTVVVKATQIASGAYKQLGAQTSFTTTGTRPTSLTFQGILGKVYGDVFKVAATSASPGAITYSIVNGAASISGFIVTITGSTGSVTLQASQTASGSYPAATATITFGLSPLSPTISFAPIASQATGSSFTANVITNSPGKLTYRVVSGPATNSGSVFTVTGSGTVVIRADQDASGGYGAAHITANVQVQ